MLSCRSAYPQHKNSLPKAQSPAKRNIRKGLDMITSSSIILTAHSSQLTAHSSQLGAANALINGQVFSTKILIFPHTLLQAVKAAFYFLIIGTAGGIRICLFCAVTLRQRSCKYFINKVLYRTVSIARLHTFLVGTMCTVFRQGWQI